MVKLEIFIDDPLISKGMINFDILFSFHQGQMWKTQLKFQLKTLNGSNKLSKFLSLISGGALSSYHETQKYTKMEKFQTVRDIS